MIMMDDLSFYAFWRLYAPAKEFHNRYRACEQLWNTKDERTRKLILRRLCQTGAGGDKQLSGRKKKNPYFYLIDWRPPQPQWLTPGEQYRAMCRGEPMAVAFDPVTQTYKTCTRAEAEEFGLQVHHFM